MITNYRWVHEHPEKIMSTLIAHSFECHDYCVCVKACDILLESYHHDHVRLSIEQVK